MGICGSVWVCMGLICCARDQIVVSGFEKTQRILAIEIEMLERWWYDFRSGDWG